MRKIKLKLKTKRETLSNNKMQLKQKMIELLLKLFLETVPRLTDLRMNLTSRLQRRRLIHGLIDRE